MDEISRTQNAIRNVVESFEVFAIQKTSTWFITAVKA